MKRYFVILMLLTVGLVFVACSSKKSDDPIATIESISEKVSSSGDNWDEDSWEKVAEQLEEALNNLPSPLETDEEFTLSSALSSISFIADMHERKAAKMIEVLNKYNERNESEESVGVEVINQSYDLGGAVDRYPITMHLDVEGSQVKGSYYYNKRGPSAKLFLSGIYDDGEMNLNETDEKGVPTGHFKGEFEDGSFKGQFIDSKGKSMNFLVSEAGATVDEVLAAFDDADLPDDFESLPDYGDDDDEGISDDEGDESVDKFLDEYEKFWKKYMSFIKKANQNDPKWIAEYTELLQESAEYTKKLEKIKGKISSSQLNRINKMSMEMLQEAQKMQR